ncbi:thiol peroxidase [Iodobacter fluviatilis]|uniref:Thiol peroxidase n=1 Tax=Iodobacter fluviatilis TaxID=537 RepID=A0A377Q5U3_9NEIS|nr:thiol peroxidase [Iodobacter fluviatilis]TCU84504.1 thiol peroxidase [Iodobacter fluviatilis]STQ89969.1 Thiol peroxidase [Iodobacter fluviatilis]
MATVYLNHTEINVGGQFPVVGEYAHSFLLVDSGMIDVPLSRFAGKPKIIAVIPSIDSEIGLIIARQLDRLSADWPDCVILVISVDTPYALSRVIEQERFRRVQLLCTLRGRDFHKDYGVMITDIPLSGFMATALIGLNAYDIVMYSELVSDLSFEPDYGAMAECLFPPVEEESEPIIDDAEQIAKLERYEPNS